MVKFNCYRMLYSIIETYKSEKGRCLIKLVLDFFLRFGRARL